MSCKAMTPVPLNVLPEVAFKDWPLNERLPFLTPEAFSEWIGANVTYDEDMKYAQEVLKKIGFLPTY